LDEMKLMICYFSANGTIPTPSKMKNSFLKNFNPIFK